MPNPAKQILREKIKDIIKNLSTEEKRRQSEAVAEKILNNPNYKRAERISIYLSTADEVNTLPIISDMFLTKKRVFVPTYNKNVMEMVELRDLNDYENLPLTKWNIKQPKITDERENAMDIGLDMFILPGVAFNLTGGRCGHGMGYYDKYLTKFFNKHSRQDTKLFAIAFNEQLVQDLPVDSHDFQLDGVILP